MTATPELNVTISRTQSVSESLERVRKHMREAGLPTWDTDACVIAFALGAYGMHLEITEGQQA